MRAGQRKCYSCVTHTHTHKHKIKKINDHANEREQAKHWQLNDAKKSILQSERTLDSLPSDMIEPFLHYMKEFFMFDMHTLPTKQEPNNK